MKLRNKKTGELCEDIWYDDLARTIVICGEYYSSLEAILADYEDYKPVEPLIRDEKVRKAVRAWAEAEKVDLSCVTEPGKNPLKDCKQSKKYALECGPQYVKLPKEKCEIKEQQ